MQSNKTVHADRSLNDTHMYNISNIVQIAPFNRHPDLEPLQLSWNLHKMSQSAIQLQLNIQEPIQVSQEYQPDRIAVQLNLA